MRWILMAYANFIIFEYDTWPVSTRTHTFYSGGSSISKQYRSSDGSYYGGTKYKDNFIGFEHSDNCEAFITEYFDFI